jgi:hypothetical protein
MPKKHNPIKNLKQWAHPKGGGVAKVSKTSKSKLAKVTKQIKGY